MFLKHLTTVGTLHCHHTHIIVVQVGILSYEVLTLTTSLDFSALNSSSRSDFVTEVVHLIYHLFVNPFVRLFALLCPFIISKFVCS